MFTWKKWGLLLALCACLSLPARALDLTEGLMHALPTQGGPPAIDGDLKEWDLSAAEPIWIAPETIRLFNADVAMMYDDEAIYVGAKISLPNRPIRNPNNPVDAFWWGDVLELRVAADPSLPAPLNAAVNSDRIAHVTMWKNSQTGKDYLHIVYGVKFDKGKVVNPPGTALVIKEHGTQHYTLEARIPWSALNVPGGKNPFKPGQRMTAVWSPHWGGETQVAALYRQNPGSFAFKQPQTWGQIEFSATGQLKPRHETLGEVVARYAAPDVADVGVPIALRVPQKSLVSINIFGPNGEVLRELMGGEMHEAGPLTVRWDGKDQWGLPLAPGTYKWGAYFSGGLRARYMGGVGKSGHPYYETADGKGGWGADHSEPIDVAADKENLYFLWPVAEAGKNIVKTDLAGNVLWRKTPFVGGGFGPLWAVASNGTHVFLTFGTNKPQLLRLDALTGQMLTWGGDAGTGSLMPISDSDAVKVPEGFSPIGGQPESSGLAANDKAVFASVYSQNKIQVLDPQSGAQVRTLDCPGPRGLALGPQGDLYAVSYVAGQTPRVLRFSGGFLASRPIVTGGLVAPWDVAVDERGYLFVTDGGESQQVKVFNPEGRQVSVWGKKGGRPWAGAYDASNFLNPVGIAADARGGILVAESAIPKVMSRWDAVTGKPIRHWFGAPVYWNANIGDPENPWTSYYPTGGGFARATVPAPGRNGYPDAYWSLTNAGYPDVSTMYNYYASPEVLLAGNGLKYMVSDSDPHGVALMRGDQVLPVGHAKRFYAGDPANPTKKNYVQIWSDANGDHRLQPGEISVVDAIDGKPISDIGVHTGSMHMQPNGDLYLMTSGNRILKVPAAGFAPNGAIRWDAKRASYVVPTVLPALGKAMYIGPRGQAGIRVDTKGNVYTAFSANAPALTPELRAQMEERFPQLPPTHWGAYATAEMAKRMREGLGWTGGSNIAKFAKYDPQGRLLWMAGRKATAAAKAGEMYHFWVLAGLMGQPGNEYIAGASEWGQIYFYTHDGFFVDALMNNPGLAPPAGPYTFGSETSGARVQYYPKRDELWAYSTGMLYRVDGFEKGRVAGEQRIFGQVALDKVYESGEAAAQKAEPLRIVALEGDPLQDAAIWQEAPVSTLTRNGAPLATAQLGYDAQNLYGRIHVEDATPLQNAAEAVNLAFKGGDTAGIVLGPGGPHAQPAAGDVRLMAAQIDGRARLIAMKPFSAQAKQPEDYYTPANGHARFDFVGEVPGGRVLLQPDADGKGYTALFAVPRSFLEFPLEAGSTLAGDVEVRLSGQGARGLQATSRNYLFTPQLAPTSMTDDVPTEARLYPQYWGEVAVR